MQQISEKTWLQPHLLALVDSSLEFLLMLTLLSFFLGVLVSFSVCWLEDEDEEELVLALESSSDIATPPPHTPTWRGDTMGRGEQTVNTNTHRERLLTISLCVWVTLLLKSPCVSLSSSGPTVEAREAAASPALLTQSSRGKGTSKASSQKASAKWQEKRLERGRLRGSGKLKANPSNLPQTAHTRGAITTHHYLA